LNGSGKLRIYDDGIIGMSDWTPDARLEVSADGGSNDIFMLSSDDDSDGDIFIVKSNGNVGIGTITPGYKLHVNGTIRAEGADFAEPFDMTSIENIEMGDVVVIDPEHPEHLRKSSFAYDSLAAGIISSKEQAGYIAGARSDGSSDKPLALVGRVICKVSTENGTIKVGDLLTTSNTPGHAMKADDKERSFGAIIGKALQPLDATKGTIMVLVTLQ